MADDKRRTEYNQADGYTNKNATIGIQPPPGYELIQTHATDEYTRKDTTFGAEPPPTYEQVQPHATDEYIGKNTTFGAESQPTSEQATPQEDDGHWQPPYAQPSTSVVVNQPHQIEGVVVQKRPMDYTVFSILACLCCCWPIAICAMCYATDANTLWKAGDFEGARRKAKISRNLIIASAVFGIIAYGLWIASRVIYGPDMNQIGGW